MSLEAVKEKVEEIIEEVEEDEEDEEDIEDPLNGVRELCQAKSECQNYHKEFTACQDRVNSKSETTEQCTQEFFDYLHCVDHCVAHKIFDHLK
eukprot:m.25231 g.25231  ORF g.25231 m.25231 type:complete len:93 (-) comp7803_c0_seq1:278-556(-)